MDHSITKRRVLVVWGSTRGGTEGIAHMVAQTLEREGLEVALRRGPDGGHVESFDAVIVGGAMYANRWHHDARRFVSRHVAALRKVPTWFFSSGPLDDSAEKQELPPPDELAVLMERVGALGHVTFGGYLAADAKGFMASSMAKQVHGDWRNPERIAAWAGSVASRLPTARPGAAVDPPARSPGRLVAHGLLGWALSAAVLVGLLRVTSAGVAFALHAVLAPLSFLAIAVHYFRPRGARDALPTALTWTLLVAGLDALVVAGLLLRDFTMFTSFVGTWLPFALIFLVTWSTGAVRATMPWPKPEDVGGPRRGGPPATAHPV